MPGEHILNIDLLGTSFTVRSSEEQAYLDQILEYLEKKIDETKQKIKTSDPIKIALLTNIFLIDELFKEKNKDGRTAVLDEDSEEMGCLALRMIDELDAVLTEKFEGQL